jgi:E3 ubiquitin-protein transferase RMND5
MEGILSAHQSLEKKGNLSKTITDVQALIDQLQRTRDAVAETPELTAMHMAKLKQPVKASFDRIEDDLKEVNKGLNQYQKALNAKFKNAALPTAATEILGDENGLVNRAIGMHLLREGSFGVARTFVREVTEAQEQQQPEQEVGTNGNPRDNDKWLHDFTDLDGMLMELEEDAEVEPREDGEVLEGKGRLQRKFTEMYNVLDSLRNQHDLGPAIAWASENSTELENRGSNLEFELSRLKFVELYTSSSESMSEDALTGPLRALQYARTVFPTFDTRYSREISNLLGSLAFSPALESSPYKAFFFNQHTWEEVSASFTREFCSMLGLSSTSPLYTAVTAGGIALPVLNKVERVMAASRGQWTSANELPVETPLPPEMFFHSIFVCPVSKEQATDANPPMRLNCGHVIAFESMEMHAKGKNKMKCPYCPVETNPRDAKRLYI